MNRFGMQLYEYLNGRKIINTHSHHQKDEVFKKYDLEKLFKMSYVNWCHVSEKGRKEFLDRVRFNSYFVWLEKSLRELYGHKEPLNEFNWNEYSDQLKSRDQMDTLKNECSYEKIILDSYNDPGSDNMHGEIFSPAFRINMFLYGNNLHTKDHNGNNPLIKYDVSFDSLDDYLDFMEDVIRKQKSQGVKALKSALAYDRDLCFSKTAKEKAERSFYGKEDIGYFQDYTFYRICEIAAELGLPLQCHTGLGLLNKTSAIYMKEVIENNPDTKFVLFHCGYPWLDDVLAMVNTYHNVYPDLCWLPLLSTAAASRMLDELIETTTCDRIFWGCDTWTAEESYGALLAVKHVLCKVLGNKIEDGYLNLKDAFYIIDRILYFNAKEFYDL